MVLAARSASASAVGYCSVYGVELKPLMFVEELCLQGQGPL